MVLVEVARKAYLASMVPVIVNVVLGEPQVVVDIVAFVSKGDFPRSRLGEKQRGKILASWVTRKLRTIAQFSIRENDSSHSQITEVAEPRTGTMASTLGAGSSLRNVETLSPPAKVHQAQDYMSLPTGISEMPATSYESSVIESPPLPSTEEDREDTPTEARHQHLDYPTPTAHDSGRDFESSFPQRDAYDNDLPPNSHTTGSTIISTPANYSGYTAYTTNSSREADPQDPAHASFDFNTEDSSPPRPAYSSKPFLSLSHQQDPSYNHKLQNSDDSGDLWTLPSGSHPSGSHTNQMSQTSNGRPHTSRSGSFDQEDWPQEAIMHANLASNGNGRYDNAGGRRNINDYDGRDYGHAL